MNTHIRIAVVGGGIAGLALASNLSKHSHLDVRMFELPFAMNSFKVSLNWFNRSDDIVARKWLIKSVGEIFEVL